jgi:hypothetical protein
MSFDAGGYRKRWKVPCTDLIGQARQVLITPARDRSALMLAMPSDTVRLTDEQTLVFARDLLRAVKEILPDGEEMESRS